MIVKTNNASVYANLFERANQALGYVDDSGKINNIDEYFAEIKNLVESPNYDPIFTILPADEEMFHINANTRQIKIPSIFSSGASVIGDEVAEIVYFDIDRYFDIQDLANTKIFIQCQTASGEKYLSDAINITTNFPGSDKLIFGWPLTSEITNAAGNVSFAVRFYNRKRDLNPELYAVNDIAGDELVYSFSTLTHQIKINNSLNFEITNGNAEKINKNEMIFSRLRNSVMAGTIPAVAPKFAQLIIDNNQPVEGSGDYVVKYDNKLYAKADYNDATIQTALNNNTARRGAEISYEWKFVDLDHSNAEATIPDSSATGMNNIDAYFLTSDSSRNIGDIYYDKNDLDEYNINVDTSSFDPTKLYEKFASISINKAGTYYVKAIDVAGRGNTAESDWVKIFIPGPATLTISIVNTSLILDEETNSVILSATSSMNNDGSEGGTTSYQWYRADNDTATGDAVGDLMVSINDLTVTATEGYYYLVGIHNVGNDTVTSKSSRCRVTYPAGAVTVNLSGSLEVTEGNEHSVTAIASAENGRSDSFEYIWYRQRNTGTDTEICRTPTLDPTAEGIQIAGGASYYCKVINTYNGDQSEGISTTVQAIND